MEQKAVIMKNIEKKTTLDKLNETIKRIVAEEMKAMLSEQVNPVFNKLQGAEKKAFKQWVLRQWFADKNKSAKWYDPEVDEDSVLNYISRSGVFPLTPVQLFTMWKDKKSLKTLLPAAEKEMADMEAEDEEERRRYNTAADVPYKDVAKVLGVSGQMTQNIELGGYDKFRSLMGKSVEELDGDEVENLNQKINVARKSAAHSVAKAIKGSKGDPRKLMSALHGEGLVPSSHAISGEERQAIKYLADNYNEEQIRSLLMADIEEDENIFKTYQMAVARTVFPDKRRKPR